MHKACALHCCRLMPRVACFGYINPGVVLIVDQYPAANSGAYFSTRRPFIGADCAMVALMLARWGYEAHLIANDLGDDAPGRETLQQLRDAGVTPHLRLRSDLRTPQEVDIADRAGTRTFFVEHNPAVWSSLLDADLSAIDAADMLYLDWYVGEAARRAARRAREAGVPVFLNVEYSLRDPLQHAELIQLATFAQVPMSDVHYPPEDPNALAEAVLALGPQAVFVTRGKHGSLVAQAGALCSLAAPPVNVRDTQGAGAVYSAAAVAALLQGKSPEAAGRMATHLASLKCAQHELPLEPLESLLARADVR